MDEALNHKMWDFPGGPVVETALPVQGAEVQSLVRELTSHMPWYAAKKVKKKEKKIIKCVWERKANFMVLKYLFSIFMQNRKL